MKKIPTSTMLWVGWILTAIFGIVAYYVMDERISNIASDAFGTALGVVMIGTITIIVLKVKKVI